MRIGFGYDSHRFEDGRRLVLGGVEFPGETGLKGHSDADVLVHAVIDALLGAAALGDIGSHFPDSDPKWKDADSALTSMSLPETESVILRMSHCGTGWSKNVTATRTMAMAQTRNKTENFRIRQQDFKTTLIGFSRLNRRVPCDWHLLGESNSSSQDENLMS